MTCNLLNFLTPAIDFIINVFNFLVEKTGSEIMAYVSIILVELLAIALLVFIIIALIKGFKRNKTKKSTQKTSIAVDSTESKQTDVVVNDAQETVDNPVENNANEGSTTPELTEDAVSKNVESAPSSTTETLEKGSPEEKPTPKKSQGKIYDDGIPAMPIYRKSKYEKPRTILVKKDKSKVRNAPTEKE